MRRPLIIILIALIAGILLGGSVTPQANFLFLSAALIWSGIFFVWRKKHVRTAFFLLMVFAFIFGVFNIQRQNYFPEKHPNIASFADRGNLTVEGWVVDHSAFLPEKDILVVRCLRLVEGDHEQPVSGKIRLTIPPESHFDYGDFVRVRTSIKTARAFHNPGAIRYGQTMSLRGIEAFGHIHDASGIMLLRKKTGSGFKQIIDAFRNRIRKLIALNVPSPQKEILLAMTIGAKNEIPDAIREQFNNTGTAHILAISGLHMGLIGATSFLFFLFLFKFSEYLMLRFNLLKLAALCAFSVILLYAFVAGMGVTVMRATLMAFMFLWAVLFGKQKDLYNILAMAGLIILTLAPEALWDVSFQLSFVSVLSIIYIVPRFSDSFPAKAESLPVWAISLLRFIYLSILVSAAATLGTFPLILYYFHRISFVSVLANLIIVPLLGSVTLSFLLLFLVCALFVPQIAAYILMPASFVTSIGLHIIKTMASWNWSSAQFPQPGVLEILLFYLCIFFVFKFTEVRKDPPFKFRRSLFKYLCLMSLAFLIADITYFALRDRFSSNLQMTVLDVGQGNSIFLKLPRGHNVLIDGGGFANSSLDVGKAVVASFLYHEKIRKIDTVVLSHPHPDHLLGLIYILNHFHVRNIWKNALPIDPLEFPQWEEAISGQNIAVSVFSRQSPEIMINGVAFKILWPPDSLGKKDRLLSEDDVNDSSLVLKITFGNVRFLIPGDISAEVEKKLVITQADLASDVLIVPHHGSNKSSSPQFIKAVGCRYAVISVGKFNIFKHPHPSVIARYRNAETTIFRTDQNGAVTFITDGRTLKTDAFLK